MSVGKDRHIQKAATTYFMRMTRAIRAITEHPPCLYSLFGLGSLAPKLCTDACGLGAQTKLACSTTTDQLRMKNGGLAACPQSAAGTRLVCMPAPAKPPNPQDLGFLQTRDRRLSLFFSFRTTRIEFCDATQKEKRHVDLSASVAA